MSQRKRVFYDPACERLAAIFLRQETALTGSAFDDALKSLSEVLQQAADDWFAVNEEVVKPS